MPPASNIPTHLEVILWEHLQCTSFYLSPLRNTLFCTCSGKISFYSCTTSPLPTTSFASVKFPIRRPPAPAGPSQTFQIPHRGQKEGPSHCIWKAPHLSFTLGRSSPHTLLCCKKNAHIITLLYASAHGAQKMHGRPPPPDGDTSGKEAATATWKGAPGACTTTLPRCTTCHPHFPPTFSRRAQEVLPICTSWTPLCTAWRRCLKPGAHNLSTGTPPPALHPPALHCLHWVGGSLFPALWKNLQRLLWRQWEGRTTPICHCHHSFYLCTLYSHLLHLFGADL